MTGFTAAATRVIVERRALSAYGEAYDWIGGQIPCECCGEWCNPELHHRKFRSRGGDWRPSNILALCHACHHAVTTCYTGWARELGLSVTQFGGEPEESPVQPWYGNGHRILLDNDGGWTMLDNAA